MTGMTTVAAMLALTIGLQSGTDRADVTFVNSSKFTISVFIKNHRRLVGPIQSGDYLTLPNGFALGENDYLVVRQLKERSTLNTHALLAPARHRLYPAATGRPPAPVQIELQDTHFKVVADQARNLPVKIENNTDYPLFAAVKGKASTFGPVFSGKTNQFPSALTKGHNELVLIAYADARPDGQVSDEIIDLAFVSVQSGASQTNPAIVAVTDKTFGERGLPPKQGPPEAAPPKPTIEGKWRTPEGLAVRFEGSNGYWVEVGYLAEFGFKPGDHGYRNIKEDPSKPGTFTGEVRYRFRGGEEAGWQPFSVTVVDKVTLKNAAGEWRRID